MSDTKKTLGEWEKQKGMIIPGADPKDKLDEKDFDAIPITDKVGVNHDDRVNFLRANGYEVNRDNLVNRDLSAKNDSTA